MESGEHQEREMWKNVEVAKARLSEAQGFLVKVEFWKVWDGVKEQSKPGEQSQLCLEEMAFLPPINLKYSLI